MDISEEKKRADKFSKGFYQQEKFNAFLSKYRIETILENCSGRKTLLDIGCSFGKIAKELSSNFEKITAVDGSDDLIKQAREENSAPNINYKVSLLEELELEDKFDVVLMSFILEHVADPIKTLEKAASFLNSGGILFVMIPNAESLHRRVGKAMGEIKELDELTLKDINHGHRRVYSMEKFSKDVEDAGLKVKKMGTFFIKPFSNSQMEQFDEKICDALFEVGKDLPGLGSMIYSVIVR
jgi:2-polyprenyl-3-methyl-5-hydroxy-6-metoxy-1,4-benzoquinol methylase